MTLVCGVIAFLEAGIGIGGSVTPMHRAQDAA